MDTAGEMGIENLVFFIFFYISSLRSWCVNHALQHKRTIKRKWGSRDGFASRSVHLFGHESKNGIFSVFSSFTKRLSYNPRSIMRTKDVFMESSFIFSP